MQMDGDKTTIFHDIDGSVSEYPGAFLVKEDNWLLRHPDCIDVPDWKGAICSGHYAQVGQQVSHSIAQSFIFIYQSSQTQMSFLVDCVHFPILSAFSSGSYISP